MIPTPILLDKTPIGGLILPVAAGRGGLSGYVLLGLLGPPATAELSTDAGATWAALTWPHTLVPGEQLRLTRTDTSNLLTTLRALAPLDEGGDLTPLENDVPVEGLGGAQGSLRLFTVEIPEGTGQLRVTTTGGEGDLDLYLRRGAPPVPASDTGAGTADARSEEIDTNAEQVTLESPEAGTWYVGLAGYAAYSGATLRAVWGEGGGDPFTTTTDTDGYQTITNATATTDADGYQTIQDATATADADGYQTVERG